MKTIYQSVLITVLSALVLISAFTLIGLLLNFWNESVLNASIALVASLILGFISIAGLSVLIEQKR